MAPDPAATDRRLDRMDELVATVAAIEDTRLLSLNGDGFKDLMHHMADISFEICRSLSTRVRGLESAQRDRH